MIDLPQIEGITLKSYINEIKKSIKDGNYLSVLTMSLMIPDICSNYMKWEGNEGYIKWFDTYVFPYNEVSKEQLKNKYGNHIPKIHNITFDGKACYILRCFVLHEGTTPIADFYSKEKDMRQVKKIELSVNSKSDELNQYGEAKRIVTYGNTEEQTIRLNIVNLANEIIKGCNRFLEENKIDDIKLFLMIDWDKKGNIVFNPKINN